MVSCISREFFVNALVAVNALTLVFIFDIFSPNKKWLAAKAQQPTH
jgi:hypothetical protein